jgi:hypothetical protein
MVITATVDGGLRSDRQADVCHPSHAKALVEWVGEMNLDQEQREHLRGPESRRERGVL